MKLSLNKTNILLLLILTITSMISFVIISECLNTKELFYNSLIEILSEDKVKDVMGFKQKWSWINYVVNPLIILIRSSLITLTLSVGLFFYNLENEIKFNAIFNKVLYCEFVLILAGYFKFLYFFLIKTNYSLKDFEYYYPLSYTNFLNLENIESWLIYPLQTFNLFEVSYFFVLVYGIHKLLKNKYSKSLKIVGVSYGSGLVIWIGLVMFLSLNMS